MKKTLALVLIMIAGGVLFFLKGHYLQNNPQTLQDIKLQWTISPKEIVDLNQPVSFQFQLKDFQNQNIEDADIDVVANMSHPGMVPVTGAATNLGSGKYQSNLILTMHGDWILFLTIKLKNNSVIKKEILFKTAQ